MTAAPLSAGLARLRRARTRHRARASAALALAILAVAALTLSIGHTVTPPLDLLRALAGAEVPGTSFALHQLRLPRAVLSLLSGAAFGLGGAVFQTMLRNQLASPDIVGITSGAGAAAVAGIVLFSLSGAAVSLLAVGGGLGVALLIYLLAWRDGVAGTRLILVGIGMSAMLQSATLYILSKAPSWTLQEATRWLAGSVNGAQLGQALPLLAALAVFGTAIFLAARDLEALRLGDDMAAALGVRLGRVRLMAVLAATGLVAVATAMAGPVAFVAFLSGPVASRLLGPGRAPFAAAALTGALLVLAADFTGQVLLPSRYPVGVVTGLLGAPYLVYLVIRQNRRGTPT
ncbi:iron chelate uptake ABC transporter family permease subunit [Poseidonocella sp. HB161398]|uniref:FecCD family ABC transporter permease n=1 Tax=Poseidonocella sp. HB161398 TaxID=2320855 RepID=UPI0011094D82|nr:iron chelate uptake ABC transporter family permease subunit [Poseidonocella sp. HB161398]